MLSRKKNRNAKKPPGPKGLPLIGNILDVKGSNIHHCLDKWAKEYGEVYSVKLLNQEAVVFSSASAIREAFVLEPTSTAFADKVPRLIPKLITYGLKDIAFSPAGPHQVKLRKIGHRMLKAYGEGVHKIEQVATVEMKVILKEYENTCGKDFSPDKYIFKLVANTICKLLVGITFDLDSKGSASIRSFITATSNILRPNLIAVMDVFPFLQYVPPFKGLINDVLESRDEFIKDFYLSSRETLNPDKLRGIVDELLVCPEITKTEAKSFALDFVIAGTITTYGALSCITALLRTRPDVQRKIQQEINTVVGDDRVPVFSDRHHMPYTEAAILESLRYLTHIPLLANHCASVDTDFHGYNVDKGTAVFINLWSAHHDEATWGDPWVFRPDRFLDDDGNLFRVDHPLRRSVLTFGIGKRSCIGEIIARVRIFLYVTAVLQRFTLEATEKTMPSADPRGFQPGFILMPQPYTLRVVPR